MASPIVMPNPAGIPASAPRSFTSGTVGTHLGQPDSSRQAGNGRGRSSILPLASPAQLAAIRPEILLAIQPPILREMEAYFSEAVPALLGRHLTHSEDLRRIQTYLDNRNPDTPPRLGLANFNVPLMLQHRNAAANRLERAIFGHDLPAEIAPTGRKRGDEALIGTLNRLAIFVKHALSSTRMLNGRAVLSDVICDKTDAGTGAWAIILEPDELANIPERTGSEQDPTDPRRRDGTPRQERPTAVRRAVRMGGVTWKFIPFQQLLIWDGYDTDFNEMPFCGYRTRKTWQQIVTWERQGFYYPGTAQAVQQAFMDDRFGRTTGPPFVQGQGIGGTPVGADSRPAHLREHDVSVIFVSWDVNNDGLAEEVVLEFHNEARRIMRVYWNQFDGHRPLVGSQYSKPSRRRAYRGLGIAQMTIQGQAEANELHNHTIEAGKRGGSHMIVVRRDSGIDEELADDSEPFIVGDIFSTENVNDDVEIKELGDARAGMFLSALEDRVQVQAARLTGFTDPNFGNVQSAKRVPASLGLPIMAQSQGGSDRAITNLSDAVQEALYLTFAAWRKRFPKRALLSILEPADVDVLLNLVFSPESGTDLRDDIAITVSAKDVSGTEDQKRQSLLLLIQFLFSYFDRVAALIQSSVTASMQLQQVNPAAGQAMMAILMELLTKIQASVAALVRITEELGDPQDVLLELDGLQRALATLFNPAAPALGGGGTGAAGTPDPALAFAGTLPDAGLLSSGVPAGVPDLGAGVT